MHKLITFSVLFLFSLCLSAQNSVSGQLFLHDDSPMTSGANVMIEGSDLPSVVSDAQGNYSFTSADPIAGSLSLQKTADYSFGLDILDMIAVRAHVLGIDILDFREQIAADVNGSGGVTTADIVFIRQVVTGAAGGFATQPDWTFLPENFTPDNQIAYPVAVSTDNSAVTENFYAVKKGDVILESQTILDETYRPTFSMEKIGCGSEIEVVMRVENYENLLGFQFGLAWDADKLELTSTESNISDLNASNLYSPAPGRLTVAYLDTQVTGETFADGTEIFRMTFTASADAEGSEISFDNNAIPVVAATAEFNYADVQFENLTIDNSSGLSVAVSFENSKLKVDEVLGGAAPYTYLWSNGTTTPLISNPESGEYFVTVTDANGCTGTATFTIVGTPTQDIVRDNSVRLLQNPVTPGGAVTLVFAENETAISEVQIVTAAGRSVAGFDANEGIFAPLTAGHYRVTVRTAAGRVVLPLVVL